MLPPLYTVFFTMGSVRSTPYAHRLWAICGNECGRTPILKDGNACSPVRLWGFRIIAMTSCHFSETYFFEEVHVAEYDISLI